MIAQIIPTKKMPRNLSYLSYHIPPHLQNNLTVGQLVTIPLRNSTSTGVVYHIQKQSLYKNKLKSILEVVDIKPIFTKKQLQLFSQLASFYFVSPSLFIHSTLPRLTSKDWGPINIVNTKKNKPGKTQYFWWHTPRTRNDFYLKKINQAKKNKSKILLVVPQIKDIYQLQKSLSLNHNQFKALHGNLKKNDKIKNWLATNQIDNYQLFIGTRSALFYPYNQLSYIIIHNEHIDDHKQYDMNPRYTTYQVALSMSKNYGATPIFNSYAPSISSYHLAQLKPSSDKSHQKIIITNLANEIGKKNFTFISDDLDNSIQELAKRKKTNIFILVNKKGDSSATTCQDCQLIFKCPHCALPLIKTKNSELVCYYCDYSEDVPPFCPKCNGANLKSTGLGIQKIESRLKKFFPKFNIHRIDQSKPQLNINYQKQNIVLGTQFALNKIDWQQFNLISAIHADQLWQHAEFKSSEKAYQLLQHLLTYAKKNAIFVIQTFKPKHPIIKSLQEQRPATFYQNELKFRKDMNYPPFCQLIKISYLHPNYQTAFKTIHHTYKQIIHYSDFQILPPFNITRKKIRNKFKFNIIIKHNQPQSLKNIIKQIPTNHLIDIDPIRLLD